MTKVRPPLTFYRALAEIADLLGWDGCGQVIGKSESYVRKLSDPDIEREISLRDARRLDAAYRRAGGDRPPFFECYALQLEIEPAVNPPTSEEMLCATGLVAKETGEAVAAALNAIGHAGSLLHRQAALREIEEAISSLRSVATKMAAPDQSLRCAGSGG